MISVTMMPNQRAAKMLRHRPMRAWELVKCTSGTHTKNSVKEMMTCGEYSGSNVSERRQGASEWQPSVLAAMRHHERQKQR